MLDLENERILIKEISSTIKNFNETYDSIKKTFEYLESDISNLRDILKNLQSFEGDLERKKRDLLIEWCLANLQNFYNREDVDDILNGYDGDVHTHSGKAITYNLIRSMFGL